MNIVHGHPTMRVLPRGGSSANSTIPDITNSFVKYMNENVETVYQMRRKFGDSRLGIFELLRWFSRISIEVWLHRSQIRVFTKGLKECEMVNVLLLKPFMRIQVISIIGGLLFFAFQEFPNW